MNKYFIIPLALLSLPLYAQHRGLSAAQEIARQHFESRYSAQNGSSQRSPRRDHQEPRLAYTAKAAQTDAYYVFNDGDTDHGFVIVGADQSARTIIGYTDHGSFDADNMPDNVRWWLSQYTQQFEQALQQKSTTAAKTAASYDVSESPVHTTVSPFIHTQWDQRTPYNLLVPSPEGDDYHFATGCVATAMAQAMYYYKYPLHGIGSKSYTQSYNGQEVTFEADFESAEYDWDNMLTDYFDGYYNDTQAHAVAELMYHAGVACNMDYHSGGSGSNSTRCLKGLVNHFGYDKSAYLADHEHYSEEEWDQLIYDQIKARRPVIYTAYQGYRSGHAFVLHGYDSDYNLYDINWGWSGYYDGKYALNMMNPDFYYFDTLHDAILNLMPDTGVEPDMPHIICPTLKMEVDGEEYLEYSASRSDKFFINLSVAYESMYDSKIELGLGLRNAYTLQLTNIESIKKDAFSFLRTTTSEPYVYARQIEYNGSYEIVPLWRKEGEDSWRILECTNSTQYPVIHVNYGREPEKIDPIFTFPTTTIGIDQTVAIESENYTGSYYLDCEDYILDFDDSTNSIIGVRPGKTLVIVYADGDMWHNPVERTFEITVTEGHVGTNSIALDLKADKIPLGGYARVGYDFDYEGNITVSCVPEGIVYFAQNRYDGNLYGERPGTAEVTFHIEGDGLFKTEDITYTVTVSDEHPDNIRISDVHFPNNGYFCSQLRMLDFSYMVERCEDTEGPSRLYYELRSYDNNLNYRIGSKEINPEYEHPELIKENWYLGSLINEENYEYYRLRFLASDKTTYIPIDGYDSIGLIDCPPLSVSYSSNDQWSTICLPFEADLPEGTIAYSIEEFQADGTLKLIENRSDRLERDKPYILHNDGNISITFHGPDIPKKISGYEKGLDGNYDPQRRITDGDYIIKEINGEWGFAKATGSDIGQYVNKYTAVLYRYPGSEIYEKFDFLKLNFVPRGDANADGEINVGDIITLQQIMSGNVLDTYDTENADVNRDGNLDIQDRYVLESKILEY